MSLVDKLDEIIELNKRRQKEIRNVPLENTKRVGRYEYELDIDESLPMKLNEQEKINKKYDSEISELYDEINKNLDDNNKLINPFSKEGE